ncbi:MAG: septum formation family protein [Nocardioidaceae bacterium]
MAVRSVAVAVAAFALLTGCSSPPPTTGPPPIGAVGDCYAVGGKAVDCTEEHVAESVFVAAETPPRSAVAIAPCQTAQARYLGQDFNTRLDVRLWVAADESWFRCDLVLRTSTLANSSLEPLMMSLRGAFRIAVPVKLQACLDEAYDSATDQPYAACTSPHKSRQLIIAPAIGTVKEPFPADVADRAGRACNASAAAERQLVGQLRVEAFYPNTAAAWATGERGANCWVTAINGLLPAVEPTARS